MSKSLRYVDEFDFAPAGKTVGEPLRGRMLRDKSSLGIKGNKNPGVKDSAKPVAPKQPMLPAYAKGGKVKGCYEDGGNVTTTAAMPPRGRKSRPERPMRPERPERTMRPERPERPVGGAFNFKPKIAPLTAMKTGGAVPKTRATNKK